MSVDESSPLHLLIGRDAGGHWVVRDNEGRCGGLFASYGDAVRYARAESQSRLPRTTIVSAVDSLELAPIFVSSHAA